MSTSKTPNYLLHSWLGTDYVKRTEFNENFTIIDTTLKTLDTNIAGKAATSHVHAAGTQTVAGFISTADKIKLDGITAGANAYTHPATHPPSIIVQDVSNRFVTDAEKAAWNAKAPTAVVTTSANGLMIAADKSKLDGIAPGANVYTHPANHPAAIITQDSSNRFVTDTEKSNWNAKATTAIATTVADGLMDSADKVKLNGIAAGAQTNQNAFSNVLANGVTVAADNATDTFEIAAGTNVVVTGDATNDKITISLGAAVETTTGSQTKATAAQNAAEAASTPISHVGTNGSAHAVVTTTVNGFMVAADKVKLDGIATGATNYTHPANHPPSIITQDASNRFVTDTEKATWNAKAPTTAVTTSANGLMIASDKSKLDGIASGANAYVHPTGAGNNHIPAAGALSQVLRNNGLGIAAWGSVNGHEIVEDASHRLITDAERVAWNAKETPAGAKLQIEQDSFKVSKSGKDSNGIFLTVEHRRKTDNLMVRRSVLSGGTSPLYTTRTVTFFAANGGTTVKTDVFTLLYDADGDLISEV